MFLSSFNYSSPKPDGYTKALTDKLRLYQDPTKKNAKPTNAGRQNHIIGLESLVDTKDGQPNFIAIQINAKLPFQFDVVYRNELDFGEN